MSRESSLEVSNISFPDFDLDEGDLGGLLEWQRPSTRGSRLDLRAAGVLRGFCGVEGQGELTLLMQRWSALQQHGTR